MDITELTNKIELVSKRYAKEFGIKRDSTWFILKLHEELGEMTQAYLMLVNKARKKGLSKREIEEMFEKEVADVLSHILLVAKYHTINIEKVLQEKWFSRLEK